MFPERDYSKPLVSRVPREGNQHKYSKPIIRFAHNCNFYLAPLSLKQAWLDLCQIKKPRYFRIRVLSNYAEEEGFEPPVPCGTTVFKTAAFDHSAIPPGPQN